MARFLENKEIQNNGFCHHCFDNGDACHNVKGGIQSYVKRRVPAFDLPRQQDGSVQIVDRWYAMKVREGTVEQCIAQQNGSGVPLDRSK